MKSVLTDLYNGELCPSEQTKVILKVVTEHRESLRIDDEIFKNKLNDELKYEFESLMSKHYSIWPDEIAEIFAEGFSLGLRIMIEATYN